MACLSCYRSREEGDKYCRACGSNVLTNEDPKHTTNLLTALLGVELIVSVCWLILQKGIAKLLFQTPEGDIDWSKAGTIYDILGWITDIVVIITALICTLLVKNNNVRILFILYLIFRVAFLIAYRIFN